MLCLTPVCSPIRTARAACSRVARAALLTAACALALFAAPASHALAAVRFPASPSHELAPASGGNSCVLEYGVSYDADTFSLVYYGGEYDPVFSFGAFDPVIGAYACASQNDFAHLAFVVLYFTGLPFGQQGWYNILTTVAGQTTQATFDSSAVYDIARPDGTPSNLYAIFYSTTPDLLPHLPLQVRQPYSVQVQYCRLSPQGVSCSLWSPHMQFTVSANNGCLSGYVPRLANPYDQVCVTPAEQAQVAYDNSQIDNRLDTGTVSGEIRCIRGYVWRGAFGGDMACVSLAQRAQVAQDNSLAPSRIIAP